MFGWTWVKYLSEGGGWGQLRRDFEHSCALYGEAILLWGADDPRTVAAGAQAGAKLQQMIEAVNIDNAEKEHINDATD